MQGFFKHGLLDMKSWLSKKAHSRPHTRAASCPVVVAVTGGTGVNLPSSSKGECARWAGCSTSQRRPQMAGTGAFHGAGRKAAGPRCVGGFLPRVLQCPVGTALAVPSALALTMLSPAAAHPCSTSVHFPVHQPMHPQESRQVLIAGNKVLTANNQHKAPVTYSSNTSTSHPAPCGWASLVSCPGTGFAETLESIQCILAQHK